MIIRLWKSFFKKKEEVQEPVAFPMEKPKEGHQPEPVSLTVTVTEDPAPVVQPEKKKPSLQRKPKVGETAAKSAKAADGIKPKRTFKKRITSKK